MLYQIKEFQRAMLEPLSSWAQSTAKALTDPMNPLSKTPLAHRISASYELLHRLGKEYEKPSFGIREVTAHGSEVTVVDHPVLIKPFCELVRFRRFSEDTNVVNALNADPIVLIVAPLSGHHATLLRDTVKVMLQNHQVYITDWLDARLVPTSKGKFHLNDYIDYVQEFIRFLGADQLHVISVCQPTVPVLAAISLMASNGEKTPLTMTMMGGPIDARKSPTAVNSLATNKPYAWFEKNLIHEVPKNYPGAGRKVYPGFLQHASFVAMNPDRHMKSHWDYFVDLLKGDEQDTAAHRQFYDEYNAVLDMDSAYYLETIKTVFQDHALPNGTWKVHGQLVRPQDIKTTALLAVEGEFDDISGSGQTNAALDLCSGIPKNRKQAYEAKGAGHYGIFSGKRWREMVYPTISAFIREYPAATPAKKSAPLKVTKATPVAAKKTAVPKTPVKTARKTISTKTVKA